MNNSSFIKLLVVFSICILGYNITNGQSSKSGEIKEESIARSEGMGKLMERLNQTNLVFCNQLSGKINVTKTRKTEARPGTKKEFCLGAINTSTGPVNILIGFSEGQKDSKGKRVCDQDMGPDNPFSSLIEGENLNQDKNIDTTIMPGIDKIMDKNYINIPRQVSGDIYGCVAFKIKGDRYRGSGSIFDVIVRKTIPIKISITGSAYNYLWILDDTKDNIIENKELILKVLIGIILLRLIVSIIQTAKDKHSKKQHHKHK